MQLVREGSRGRVTAEQKCEAMWEQNIPRAGGREHSAEGAAGDDSNADAHTLRKERREGLQTTSWL